MKMVSSCLSRPFLFMTASMFAFSLTSCSGRPTGKDIDLPPQRPGRFMQAAAPAEQKAATQEQQKEAQREKAHSAHHTHKDKHPSQDEEHYEPLPPEYGGGGANGPIKTPNGHTVTPQTNVIYGAPDQPGSHEQEEKTH